MRVVATDGVGQIRHLVAVILLHCPDEGLARMVVNIDARHRCIDVKRSNLLGALLCLHEYLVQRRGQLRIVLPLPALLWNLLQDSRPVLLSPLVQVFAFDVVRFRPQLSCVSYIDLFDD